MRRLGETQKWGGSRLRSARRGCAGAARATPSRFTSAWMHALSQAQESFTSKWDVQRWGMPINQSDQAATLGVVQWRAPDRLPGAGCAY